MEKAKIILTAIAVFAVVGGALAFKTVNFNAFPLWTISGIYTVYGTTTVGGPVYTATVPYCKQIPLYATSFGPVLLNVFESAPALVIATATNGATTFVLYRACASFLTFTRVAV